MNVTLTHLQSLYDQELYSNIIQICNLTLTAAEQKPELQLFGADKLHVLTLYADSLLKTQQYSAAEDVYRHALQICKDSPKGKKEANDMTNGVEIRYKIYQCLMALKQRNEAMDILQGIQARARTPKINMALGNLYRDTGMERSAVTCYKEVLRECPLALEAVDNLLRLGVKGVEVNSLMVEVVNDMSWLSLWLKAQAQLYSRDFSSAIQTYKMLDSHGLLKDNTNLLVNMGHCYHYMCEDEKAIFVLQRALRLDHNLVFGRDLLATLLAANPTKDNVAYFEKMAPTNQHMMAWRSEHWVVLGNYMYATKKHEKALFYGQQALANAYNVEGLLLKCRALMELNKHQDATHHCNKALQICSFRFDLHQCLVECYIKMNRIREAEAMALHACQQLNYSPQTLTLHASVLLKDPTTSSKTVKKILEKAVAQDKTFSTNAVCMLVEFLEQEQQYDQAKQLLLKYVDQFPSSRLHQLLGDCYVNLQKDDDAFHHYNVALRLDPNNQRATEGLNLIGRNLSLSKRDSYYTCVGETSFASQENSEDHEVYNESDTDPWPSNNSFEI